MKKMNYLVTVIAEDRIGIIRDVSGALFAAGANIRDLRQNLVSGVFTLSCLVEFNKDFDLQLLEEEFEKKLADCDAEFSIRPIAHPQEQEEKETFGRYVAAISGPDLPGRIHFITDFFAAKSLNVIDWHYDSTDAKNALTVGIVAVPKGTDVKRIDEELRAAGATLGLVTSFRHENIFRAINEVGPIDSLLSR